MATFIGLIMNSKCQQTLNNSLKMNMYYRKREWHYKNISPLILAEHYVDLYRDANTNATITTCRVHCFEGQPKYVEVDVQGSDGTEYSNIYDTSWVYSLSPSIAKRIRQKR